MSQAVLEDSNANSLVNTDKENESNYEQKETPTYFTKSRQRKDLRY